jgi:LacI family transcriptional regulator
MRQMKRVTLREIAAKAGVSTMAVSLALRDSGQVSTATRQRLKSLADKMGYRPDPALSALMSYRHERQTVRDYSTLAFITHFSTSDGWRREVYTREYFAGAVERANKLGYRVEAFWLGASRLSSKRAAQILESRGIKGLLVAPVPAARGEISLPWERFCGVSLCRNLASPDLNVVDHNHYQSMSIACREVRRRGYLRIGYAVTKYSEEIAGRLWLATLLMEQSRAGSEERHIAPLVTDDWCKEVFHRWLQTAGPDVVISPHIAAYRWLTELGYHIPRDIGFAWLEAEPSAKVSGVCQHFRNVGVVGVDLLHLELTRSAYGLPSVRQTIGIDGEWMEGTTLRPAPV